MASSSAGDRLVHTTELLEKIILYIIDGHKKQNEPQREETMLTLLSDQHVCRQFRNTILGSPELSRALFLRPTPGDFNSTTTIQNPLLPIFDYPWIRTLTFDGFEFDVTVYEDPLFKPLGGKGSGIENICVSFRTYSKGENMLPPSTQGSWRGMRIWDCDYRVTIVKRWIRPLGLERQTYDGQWKNATLGELFDVAFQESATEKA